MRLNPWKKTLGVVSSSQSSIFHHGRNSDSFFIPALCGIFLLHLCLAALLPPLEDELYFWTWARPLQASYFDHPPMVAYLMRVSTAIFGNSIFGIRFFACVLTFLTLFLISTLTKTRNLMFLFLFTPLVLVCGAIMVPDTPFLFFWACYLKWFTGVAKKFSDWEFDPVYRAYHQSPVPWWIWIQGGVLLGLGMLSKYTMALACLCGFFALAFHHRFRSWALGFLFHGLVALIILIPLFLYNADHQWAPLLFQWHRSLHGTGSAAAFGDFLAAQILMVGLLPILCLPWIVAQAKSFFETPTTRVCFWFFVPPLLFFFFKATQGKLEANWGFAAYLAFWPLIELLFQRTSFDGLKKSLVVLGFGPAWSASVALVIHLVHPLPYLAPQKDRISKLLSNQVSATEIAAAIKANNPKSLPVLAGRYQWVSYLRFHGVFTEQVIPYGRENNFSLGKPDTCEKKSAIVLIENGEFPPALHCYPLMKTLKEFSYVVRGVPLGSFRLVEMTQEPKR